MMKKWGWGKEEQGESERALFSPRTWLWKEGKIKRTTCQTFLFTLFIPIPWRVYSEAPVLNEPISTLHGVFNAFIFYAFTFNVKWIYLRTWAWRHCYEKVLDTLRKQVSQFNCNTQEPVRDIGKRRFLYLNVSFSSYIGFNMSLVLSTSPRPWANISKTNVFLSALFFI